MVRDGIYYGLGMLVAAGLLAWLVGVPYAVPPLALAGFFLWFFRDPERVVPQEPGMIVSPGDGKVTAGAPVMLEGREHQRVSIFLNVLDVHVNRGPIAGVFDVLEYRRGSLRSGMGEGEAGGGG